MLYLYYDISGTNQIYKMLNIIREVEKRRGIKPRMKLVIYQKRLLRICPVIK